MLDHAAHLRVLLVPRAARHQRPLVDVVHQRPEQEGQEVGHGDRDEDEAEVDKAGEQHAGGDDDHPAVHHPRDARVVQPRRAAEPELELLVHLLSEVVGVDVVALVGDLVHAVEELAQVATACGRILVMAY